MDRDYANVIKKKLDDVYRGGAGGTSAAVREREMRQSFIVSNIAHRMERVLNDILTGMQ